MRRRQAQVDVDSMAEEAAGEVMVRLGLEGVVDRRLVVEVMREVVSGIVESRSTKPSLESIVKRVTANAAPFLKAVAALLLSEADKLTVEQLEFIVSHAPELAGRAAPALYARALELGANWVAGALRGLWLRYGRPTPVRCPRCGFNSVAPDLSCVVCGAQLSEEEVKKSLGFPEALRSFALRADLKLVEEAANAGYVVVDDDIHPPSVKALLPFYLELHLSGAERKLLEDAIRARTRYRP